MFVNAFCLFVCLLLLFFGGGWGAGVFFSLLLFQ